MQFSEPRPLREDIPDTLTHADMLFEARLFQWEFRKWRAEVNGDLGFLSQFRDLVQIGVRGTVILVPVGLLLLSAITVFGPK